MKLYNTLTKNIDTVQPLDGERYRIYSCGPTVYDHAHIGNLSAYIFADTLRRALGLTGGQVQHVMNYTDVDDKTIRRSQEGSPVDPKAALRELTDTYIQIFQDDMHKVGNDVDAITFVRATDTIDAMKDLITQLHKAKFAYVAEDGVYFSIDAYRKSGKKYGQLLELSSQNTSEARIQNDEYDKESVHDFALWKRQKPGEPAWDFQLGGENMTGRPGWHIECSVMSRQELGQPFDIHTGGVDLIFPHHENEIAQSTALEENPIMAQIFAHNEHILVDGRKMAKSAKNFYTLQDIIDKDYDPLAFRLLVLQAHYRSQVHFSWENLAAAQNRLKRLQNFAALQWQAKEFLADNPEDSWENYDYDIELYSALADDLKTPSVLAKLSEMIDKWDVISNATLPGFRAFLRQIDAALGLALCNVPDISDEQKQLIADREQARADKDWTKSDELRDQLTKQGIGLRDTPHGAIWCRL
jgi:cysteinyl-tRNA synthetase